MAIVTTTNVVYEIRQIASTDTKALFKTTTTTTVTTEPDTPVGTVVTVEDDFLSIDYTEMYTAIADSVSSISLNSEADSFNPIVNIADKLTEISDALTDISLSLKTDSTTLSEVLSTSSLILQDLESHQKRIKEMGEEEGYKIKSPYDIFNAVAIYKLFVEEAKILDLESATEEQKQIALARVIEYMQKISDNIPKEF